MTFGQCPSCTLSLLQTVHSGILCITSLQIAINCFLLSLFMMSVIFFNEFVSNLGKPYLCTKYSLPLSSQTAITSSQEQPANRPVKLTLYGCTSSPTLPSGKP